MSSQVDVVPLSRRERYLEDGVRDGVGVGSRELVGKQESGTKEVLRESVSRSWKQSSR